MLVSCGYCVNLGSSMNAPSEYIIYVCAIDPLDGPDIDSPVNPAGLRQVIATSSSCSETMSSIKWTKPGTPSSIFHMYSRVLTKSVSGTPSLASCDFSSMQTA